jgi:hypothetical protein
MQRSKIGPNLWKQLIIVGVEICCLVYRVSIMFRDTIIYKKLCLLYAIA